MSIPVPGVFARNNLHASPSLYLRQHGDNPVWWQEWSPAVVEWARQSGRPLFVSVGYATCHWCHVMAAEAFSDAETADFLNANFVCVKVDRELRPDIDQFLMGFLQAQSGQGGWPLNAFLTPALHPLFALTYAPPVARNGQYGFADIAAQVLRYFRENAQTVAPFALPMEPLRSTLLRTARTDLLRYYDREAGGFGTGHKFPPHATLLSLLYGLAAQDNPADRQMVTHTLSAMRRGGLHDHLQGGLFRYCVDRFWTIPHFEKMLYDQAQGLWVFALAYKVLADENDRSTALGIARCLRETFARGNLYVSAHDADTLHEEGATYVWSGQELRSVLGPEDFDAFVSAYVISSAGNFEGKNHLVRRNDQAVPAAEAKLLAVRRLRKQPAVDEKILCGQNALIAVAWIQARRLLPPGDVDDQGERTLEALLAVFWNGERVAHALLGEYLQQEPFLFDVAALLYAVTLACEEDDRWLPWLAPLEHAMLRFRVEGTWMESLGTDFLPVPASRYDQPLPSSVALAELAQVRLALLRGADPVVPDYGPAFACDFSHLGALLGQGHFHWIKSPRPLPWSGLPPHVMQIRSPERSDCYKGACRLLD
jgi:uncharacterized protein